MLLIQPPIVIIRTADQLQ